MKTGISYAKILYIKAKMVSHIRYISLKLKAMTLFELKEMKLVHVKSSIMEVFDMTGFSGMLNIEN